MSDNRNFERDEIPGRTPGSENGEIEHNSMRPDRFPEGEVGNWQRKEKNLKKKKKKDSSNLEQLVNDVKGTAGARSTSSENIAGVTDIDKGLKR
jgi:hypothetical protein